MTRYLSRTFTSLQSRNFRIYSAGQVISTSGSWMQKVAQALLVLDLTGSALLLGVTAALQHAPTLLLTPLGGRLADRFDKRHILMVSQALASVPALALGVLTVTGNASIGVVLVMAAALGSIVALDKPSRLTIVSELVEPDHVANAVTLNSVIQNCGKLAGPAIAGVVIATKGLAAGFFINAASFFAVIVALFLIRTIRTQQATLPDQDRSTLRSTVRYVRARPELAGPLVLMAVTGLLAYNFAVVLPLLAIDTFDGGPTEVGLTFSAMGLGAVVGGFAFAGSLKPTRGALMLWAMLFAAALAGLAAAPDFAIALVLMCGLGAASVMFRSSVNTILQLRTSVGSRGRVLSLYVLAINGTTPIGAPLVGWVCESLGVRVALAVASFSTATAALWAHRHMHRAEANGPVHRRVSRVPARRDEQGGRDAVRRA